MIPNIKKNPSQQRSHSSQDSNRPIMFSCTSTNLPGSKNAKSPGTSIRDSYSSYRRRNSPVLRGSGDGSPNFSNLSASDGSSSMSSSGYYHQDLSRTSSWSTCLLYADEDMFESDIVSDKSHSEWGYFADTSIDDNLDTASDTNIFQLETKSRRILF